MCRDKDKNFTATCGYLRTEGQEQSIRKVLVFGFRTRNKCKRKPHRVLSVLFTLSSQHIALKLLEYLPTAGIPHTALQSTLKKK